MDSRQTESHVDGRGGDAAPAAGSVRVLCVSCGYDLSAQMISGRCPECGTPVVNTFGRQGQPQSGKAIASMVVGIAALVIGCGSYGILGPIVGPVAIVLGYAARRDIRGGVFAPGSAGMATAGIVTGWIATALGGLAILFVLLMFGGALLF